MSEEITGAEILANSLLLQGVEYVFGIVGVPVIEVAQACQAVGIKYVAMRNEQAAAYAAQAIGFMTRMPAVCLTVSGPGQLHVIGGMANAKENAWPLIVVGGASDLEQEGMGAFQEYLQVESARLHCKFSARPSNVERIPYYVEKAIRFSTYGRPGACYIDLPGDMIRKKVAAKSVLECAKCPPPPVARANDEDVKKALRMLSSAKAPLVVVGKGAAYACAETAVREFIATTQLPFLPTPMGKGVVSDSDKLCVAAARSRALQNADVILLLGARLNWMLHFGLAPRFSNKVKVIQVDICPEEFHTTLPTSVALYGDLAAVVTQMNTELRYGAYSFKPHPDWWKSLEEKLHANEKSTQMMIDRPAPPMNYYNAFQEIRQLIPQDCIIVSEGSNTMDISRTMFPNILPRHRLDAGTFGTMGVGVGFALAAALWCRDHAPGKRVVCIEGDSAIGFSGMELETVTRYKLPVVFIVINNNGITFGADAESYSATVAESDPCTSLSPTYLAPNTRYDLVMAAFGGDAHYVTTREQLRDAVRQSLRQTERASLVNVMIDPLAQKKPQDFFWLTSNM